MGYSKYAEDIEEIRSDNLYMRDGHSYGTKPRPAFTNFSRQKETNVQKKDSEPKKL